MKETKSVINHNQLISSMGLAAKEMDFGYDFCRIRIDAKASLASSIAWGQRSKIGSNVLKLSVMKDTQKPRFTVGMT